VRSGEGGREGERHVDGRRGGTGEEGWGGAKCKTGGGRNPCAMSTLMLAISGNRPLPRARGKTTTRVVGEGKGKAGKNKSNGLGEGDRRERNNID